MGGWCRGLAFVPLSTDWLISRSSRLRNPSDGEPLCEERKQRSLLAAFEFVSGVNRILLF